MRWPLLALSAVLGLGCTQNLNAPEELPLAPNFLRLQSWLAVSADGLAADGFLRWVYLADDPSVAEEPREYCEVWEQLALDRVDSAGCAGCTDLWEGTATVEVDQGTCLDVDWDERAFGMGYGQLDSAPEDVAALESDGFTHAVYTRWSPDTGDGDSYEPMFVAQPERWSSETAPIGASGDRPVAGDYGMECLYFWDLVSDE